RRGGGGRRCAGRRAIRVEGVLNLAEGVGGRGRESQVPAVLEMLGIPCTGPDPLAIGITLDKALGKLVAKAHGIPTAPWVVADRGSAVGGLRYRLFVKPGAEGSAVGM